MLANPVIQPAYAEPLIWVLALVAMACEVQVVTWLLRRIGRASPQLQAPLFAINFTTWFVFLVAIDAADRARWPMGPAIAALELAVVLVEAVLLHSAMRGRLFTGKLGLQPVTSAQALWLSFAGNLTSVAVSLAVPGAILLLR